jgi:hypothetical protein
MKENNRISWKDETYSHLSFPDWMRAESKIYEAFRCKLIKWHIFCLAKGKIQRVKNGSWMFKKEQND